ncbi:hypothetical protein PLESTF_001446100 [Pleodorina starrii]|nr:hypothetical protein PLESTM_002024500 [Pleodorina starrii]GLC73997.1 hypothetical protein PLESTF_001446100 [Pleodorina starrii]
MRSLASKRCDGQLGLRFCQSLAPTATRPARRLTATPCALYHNPGPKESGRTKAAQQSLQRVLELVQRGERDPLVDYLATTNLTDTRSVKSACEYGITSFDEVMESMMLLSPNRHFLDSYAIRHLILSPPASTQVLSGLLLGNNKYVQRMAVTSPSGESAILTFTMTATTASPPSTEQPPATPDQGRDSPPVIWRLRSIRGEPQYGVGAVQPTQPSPELSPEQIVQAQLAALQRKDLSAAWKFVSPGSQKIYGGEHKYSERMSTNRRFRGMLGHIAATSVRRCMARPNTYMEIVSITSASGTRFVFCYILSQQTEGPSAGCWSVDIVKVVDDPQLLAAVDTSCAAQRAGRQQPQMEDE